MDELKQKGRWISDLGEGCPTLEMLIEADVIVGLTTGNEVLLKNGLMAVETVLRWTLIGKQRSVEQNVAIIVHNLHVVDATVEQLWSLESIEIRDPSENQSKLESKEIARQHFLDTVARGKDGRHTVELPWMIRLESKPPKSSK